MQATGRARQLPVVVIDKKGKPVKWATVQLVVDKVKKGVGTIVQAKVKLK